MNTCETLGSLGKHNSKKIQSLSFSQKQTLVLIWGDTPSNTFEEHEKSGQGQARSRSCNPERSPGGHMPSWVYALSNSKGPFCRQV